MAWQIYCRGDEYCFRPGSYVSTRVIIYLWFLLIILPNNFSLILLYHSWHVMNCWCHHVSLEHTDTTTVLVSLSFCFKMIGCFAHFWEVWVSFTEHLNESKSFLQHIYQYWYTDLSNYLFNSIANTLSCLSRCYEIIPKFMSCSSSRTIIVTPIHITLWQVHNAAIIQL